MAFDYSNVIVDWSRWKPSEPELWNLESAAMNDRLRQMKREAEIQLLEQLAEYDEAIEGCLRRSLTVDPGTQTLIEWRNALERAWHGPHEYLVDGRGGIIDVEDLTPIMQLGSEKPIGYFDKYGQWYPAEQPTQPQYGSMLVEYEQC